MKQNKYSNYKIIAFPDKIASFRSGTLTPPIYVRIKPINRCSHACHWCVYSDGTLREKDRPEKHLQSGMHEQMSESDVIPTQKALDLLVDLSEMGTKAVTFSGGGEPLLHRDIVPIMQQALDQNLDLSIITNGQQLKGKRAQVLAHAKWVRISIDYTSARQMVDSRNVPERFYDDIINNIHTFAELKNSKCDLGINFIITKSNYNDIVPFAKMMKSAGVENIRFSPVYVNNFAAYHAPIADRVTEQLKQCQEFCDDSFSINTTYILNSPSKQSTRPFNRCLYAQASCVIGADLNIYACHNTAYSTHGLIAGMQNRPFRDAWFSAEAKKWHETFRPCSSCLHECANHEKVAFYEKLATESIDSFV